MHDPRVTTCVGWLEPVGCCDWVLLSVPGYCRCGAKIGDTTGGELLVQAIYVNGRLIYGVCSHGIVVVDERKARHA